MLISVIVPIYKTEQYLPQCVDSILNQDYKDLEIILVDDGSPDSCPRICDEYKERDSRVKVIHKTNGGLSSARNDGLRIASGDYVMFVDSDDWWNPNVSLKNMVDFVKFNTATDMFLFTSYDYLESDGFYKRKEHNNLSTIRVDSVTHYYKDLLSNGNLEVSACTKIIKKSFIVNNSLLFKEGIVTEDSEWMIRLLRTADNIKIIDNPLYLCRFKRQESLSNTIKASNQIDTLNVVKDSLAYWKDKEDKIKKLELCFCSYLWFSSLAIASSYSKEESKMIRPYFSNTKEICHYSFSKKTRLANVVYSLFGYNLTRKVLGSYLKLRNAKLGRVKVEL